MHFLVWLCFHPFHLQVLAPASCLGPYLCSTSSCFTLTHHARRAQPSLPLAPPPPAQIHAHPQPLVPHTSPLSHHPCRAHPSLPLAPPPPPPQIQAHPQLLVPHPVNASTPSPWSAWQNAARGEATLRVPTRQPTRRILVAISQPLFNKTGMLRWAWVWQLPRKNFSC